MSPVSNRPAQPLLAWGPGWAAALVALVLAAGLIAAPAARAAATPGPAW